MMQHGAAGCCRTSTMHYSKLCHAIRPLHEPTNLWHGLPLETQLCAPTLPGTSSLTFSGAIMGIGRQEGPCGAAEAEQHLLHIQANVACKDGRQGSFVLDPVHIPAAEVAQGPLEALHCGRSDVEVLCAAPWLAKVPAMPPALEALRQRWAQEVHEGKAHGSLVPGAEGQVQQIVAAVWGPLPQKHLPRVARWDVAHGQRHGPWGQGPEAVAHGGVSGWLLLHRHLPRARRSRPAVALGGQRGFLWRLAACWRRRRCLAWGLGGHAGGAGRG
mmetsp:Transcript_33357/g.100504  ORF Transcript_33357/g.100504 Transcript_33357/m.100504 type:complete len:272 (+) Transcript_33357:161-976(+)